MPRGRPKKVTTETTETPPATKKKATRRKTTSVSKNPLERDALGLLPNIKYQYSDDGFIDWKKTVPSEHLFPNKERFKRFKKEVPKEIDGLDDDDLLIRLSGLKWAARVRGYSDVSYSVVSSQDGVCVVKCRISWIPNFEMPSPTVFEDIGSATFTNCSGFAKNFLESIATNRAFARCVRNFLNINVVSDEEIGPEAEVEQSEKSMSDITPQAIFIKVAQDKLGSLDKIVQFVNKTDVDTDGIEDIEDLKSRISASTAKVMLKELNRS